MEKTTTTDYFPPPHFERRPPPPVGTSSDDSISTIATDSTVDTLPLSFSHIASHPYSNLVYTPPARQKDQYVDDEDLLARRFDGLGIKERAEAESAARKYEDYAGERAGDPQEEQPTNGGDHSSTFASFAFPPLHYAAAPPLRHTSLPAIVTSATPFTGFSASSPITSSALLLSGSAISSTPDASPGQSPTLSSSPLPGAIEPTSHISLPPRHQPFHQRAATTSSPTTSISPRTSLSTHYPSGMARSGSTPNAAFSSSSTSPSFLQSPIARSASSVAPWAIATAGNRPGSAGTTSTAGTSSSNSRPWVFDSDASSVCSANSGGWSSGGTGGNVPTKRVSQNGGPGVGNRERRGTEDVEEFEELSEGGEVFKPESDVEFLDHRPEPADAKLSINRDDPYQVVLKVTLPGFSLDNITVAMRRGHKVHIVADSYGETGGHFEKLIHLGSDVSSVAPRAEFNGTDLNVYIQRRPSRPSSSASTAGGSTAALPPFGTIPGSPSSTFSSPDLDHRRPSSIASSFASAWSLSDAGSSHHQRDSISAPYPLSPSLEYPSPAESSSDDPRRRSIDMPPPFTVVAPPLSRIEAESRRAKSKCLTGPEGAKAAAKAAREEAALRAKEEAKKLPSSARGGRKLPFRRQKDDGTFSGSSGSNGEGSAGDSASDDGSLRAAAQSIVKKDTTSGLPHPPPFDEQRRQSIGIDRNGTIKANSRSNSPLPPTTPVDTSSSELSSSASSTTSSSASSAISSPTSSPPRVEPRPLPLFTNPSNPQNTHPRPKMREGNLTLRGPEGQSFVAQAQHQWASSKSSGNDSEMEGEGESLTPRWEHTGMKFNH